MRSQTITTETCLFLMFEQMGLKLQLDACVLKRSITEKYVCLMCPSTYGVEVTGVFTSIRSMRSQTIDNVWERNSDVRADGVGSVRYYEKLAYVLGAWNSYSSINLDILLPRFHVAFPIYEYHYRQGGSVRWEPNSGFKTHDIQHICHTHATRIENEEQKSYAHSCSHHMLWIARCVLHSITQPQYHLSRQEYWAPWRVCQDFFQRHPMPISTYQDRAPQSLRILRSTKWWSIQPGL